VNTPKRSDPSKLFIGTAANGSKTLVFGGSDFGVLIPGCATGSSLEKKSNVEGTAEGLAGWEVNRSTFVCKTSHNKIYHHRISKHPSTKH
jgi:hypothetical protein